MRDIFKKPFSDGFREIGKTAAILLAFSLIAFNFGPLMTGLRETPDAIYMEDYAELGDKLSGLFYMDGLSLSAQSRESETLSPMIVSYKLLGLLPLRKVAVYVDERPKLIPGGQPVGISIYTDGVLIVGVSGFMNAQGEYVSPAQKAGLKPGDIVLSVNGSPISSSEELKNALSDSPESVRLLIERSGERFETELSPELSGSNEPRIGAWVRDSTVGVGTLSYYDPALGEFAALGHAVRDADTGSLLKVKDGRLVLADIIGVTVGRPGSPGELHGTFDSMSFPLGSVVSNTELGIFGKLYNEAASVLGGEALEVAFPDEVHTGEAYLLASADGEVRAYSCRIVKAGKQNEPAQKGLVIEITDARLKELTGGIVQGMSGSPVIQNGRLAGVITHVLVNDPLKGYGAYVYWMIKTNGG